MAIEGLARIAATILQDVAAARQQGDEGWIAYSPTLGWERKPGFRGTAGGALREFDDAGYLTADTPQIADRRGRKRVVFIGDSNTFGFGASTPESFVEVAERRLKGVDAINLGVIGYTSYQGRLALARYLPALKPDLVVASFNFNDRRYVLRPDAHDSQEEFERTFRGKSGITTRLAGALETAYLYRGLRSLLQSAGALPRPPGEIDATRLVPRVDPESYRRNLTQIIADARAQQVPVMFLVLRDNPTQVEALRRGVDSLRKKNLDAAIDQLELAIRGAPMFADLARAYLAQALNEKGAGSEAAEASRIRSFYNSFSGGRVVRLDTEYNDIMRAVAAENGVEVIEGADVIEQRPADFVDYCHFNASGHRRLGELIAAKIAPKLGV